MSNMGLRSAVFRTAVFHATASTPDARISLSGQIVSDSAFTGTVIGTFSVLFSTGTPTFTLDDDDGLAAVIDGADLKVENTGDLEVGTYTITVSVNGTTPDPDPRQFLITVTAALDVEAPTITSDSSVSVESGATLAHTMTASETATYAITGGVDAALFEISTSTLRWLSDGTQDYAAPADSGGNNVYNVEVTAYDASLNASSPQAITVTVVEAGGDAADQAWQRLIF